MDVLAEIRQSDSIIMLVSAALNLIFLCGSWLLCSESLKSCWAKFRMKNRLKARRKAMKPDSALERHLRRVLSISLKKPMDPRAFMRYTALIFILILLTGIHTAAVHSAVIMAALTASLPYLFLRVRVETIRRKSSYEGEKLIAEFLCQYRISGLNIYKTMEQVILISEGTKITGKLLFKLLLELRNTGNPQVIRDATERFAYGINTSWSRMLANCIRIAAESGANVVLALEDINIQLREARSFLKSGNGSIRNRPGWRSFWLRPCILAQSLCR
jgi:hypothetical protein